MLPIASKLKANRRLVQYHTIEWIVPEIAEEEIESYDKKPTRTISTLMKNQEGPFRTGSALLILPNVSP